MMKACFLVCLLLSALWGVVFAQETQVPVDTKGEIPYIDRDLGDRIQMFGEYPGFRDARLFQSGDSEFVLEITYQPQSLILKQRTPLTPDSVASLRSWVTRRVYAEGAFFGNQEGRGRLLTGTTLLSLGYYGWALPVAMDAGGEAAGTLYLITSAAGFFLPYVITKDVPVTESDADLALYGGTRGIAHGILLDLIFTGDKAEARDIVVSGMVVSIPEIVIGYQVSHVNKLSPGTVGLIGLGGDLGLGLGAGAADLAGFYDDKHGRDQTRESAAMILGGGAIGLASAGLLQRGHPYSGGDVAVMRASIILGAAVPFAAIEAAGEPQHKDITVSLMAGSIAGVGLGQYLTKGKAFTSMQGTLIELSELSGALLGTGIANITQGGDAKAAPYIVMATIGGGIGFAAGYYAFADDAGKRARFSSWDVHVAPQAMTALRNDGGRTSVGLVPGLNIGIKF